MTEHAFHRAFSYGEGVIEWQGSVVCLSALLMALKRGGKLQHVHVWKRASRIFTVNGQHKTESHLCSAHTHLSDPLLVQQLVMGIN